MEKWRVEDGHWIWNGKPNRDGYGQISVNGRTTTAHRWMYQQTYGPILGPLRLVVDHTCRVRNCVNPGHLELVTYAENRRRGLLGILAEKKTHCPQGHEYTPENSYVYEYSKSPKCKTCYNARSKAQGALIRAARK